MPNKVAVDQRAKDMIIELGLLIRDCRGTLSQSQLAKRVGLPRSNMKYIEDGVNAPTADVYDKLIKELKPDLQTHHHMDHLYMAIRKVPPPDVCRTITQNNDLVDAMRKLEGCNLTPDQIERLHGIWLFCPWQRRKGCYCFHGLCGKYQSECGCAVENIQSVCTVPTGNGNGYSIP